MTQHMTPKDFLDQLKARSTAVDHASEAYQIKMLEIKLEAMTEQRDLLIKPAVSYILLNLASNDNPQVKELMDELEVTARLLEEDFNIVFDKLCHPDYFYMLRDVIKGNL